MTAMIRAGGVSLPARTSRPARRSAASKAAAARPSPGLLSGGRRPLSRPARPQSHVPSSISVVTEPASSTSGSASADVVPSEADVAARAAAAGPAVGPASTMVVGGGPAGLAAAIMLARRGWKDIRVLERLPAPPPPDSAEWGNPDRSYNMGISGRGQLALAELGALQRVVDWCAPIVGRKDWDPSGNAVERDASNKKYTTQVIQRDRLAACLLEEIEASYPGIITVEHGVEVTATEWLDGEEGGAGQVRLHIARPGQGQSLIVDKTVVDFIVGADGASSSLNKELEKEPGFEAVRYPNTNERVYKTVPLHIPVDWRRDLNYSYRSDVATMEALPTKEGGLVGLVLFKPGEEEVEGLQTSKDAREFFERRFPAFSGCVSGAEYRAFAEKPISRLPGFQYAKGRLHRGDNAALVGDSIHTVKPYFGLGVNSAFEDVVELGKCLQDCGDDTAAALPLYSKRHAKNAEALVTMSRSFDGGFATFVLPLILDGMFHKMAPWLFSPNSIQMLQKEELSFAQVTRKKTIDRALQMTCLATLVTGLVSAAVAAVRLVWQALLRHLWQALVQRVSTGFA